MLPEAVLLALDASLRCSEGILPADLSALVAAAPHLRRYSALGLRLGLLQLRNGQRTEARFTLETALAFVTNPAERARYLKSSPRSIRRPQTWLSDRTRSFAFDPAGPRRYLTV